MQLEPEPEPKPPKVEWGGTTGLAPALAVAGVHSDNANSAAFFMFILGDRR